MLARILFALMIALSMAHGDECDRCHELPAETDPAIYHDCGVGDYYGSLCAKCAEEVWFVNELDNHYCAE